jgi:hypothetical protein
MSAAVQFFGRRPPQRLDRFGMPASKNLHTRSRKRMEAKKVGPAKPRQGREAGSAGRANARALTRFRSLRQRPSVHLRRGLSQSCASICYAAISATAIPRRPADVDYRSKRGTEAPLRISGLHGLRARSPLFSSSTRRQAIARADQLFLELQPFVGRHGGLLALQRQIFHSWIITCSRRRHGLGPRVHQ